MTFRYTMATAKPPLSYVLQSYYFPTYARVEVKQKFKTARTFAAHVAPTCTNVSPHGNIHHTCNARLLRAATYRPSTYKTQTKMSTAAASSNVLGVVTLPKSRLQL